MRNNRLFLATGITVLPLFTFFLFCSFINNGAVVMKKQPKGLIFSKTSGYRHQCIKTGIEAIRKSGKENHFSVVAQKILLILTIKNRRVTKL